MNGDKPNMRELETEIFGGAGDGKAVRSSFSIQNVKMPKETDFYDNVWNEIGCQQKTAKSGNVYIDSRNATNKGIAYLYYSTWLDAEKIRKSIRPNTEFSFKIIVNKIDHYEHIINALKGLVFFGGLGTRSRRGGGSFWIKDLVCSEELKDREQSLKSLFCNPYITSIETLHTHITSNFSITTHTKNDYSHLKNAKVYLFDGKSKNQKSDWVQSLELIGKPFFEYRSQHKVVSNVSGTPNFGFPILHRSMNTTMQGGKWVTNDSKRKLDKLERRSSPLIFKLIKVNESHIFPVIIWLSGELIPSDYQIMDKSGGNTATASTSLLTSFFTTKFPALIPITL
jgi:CRISPR-associated protein Cmr1